MFMTVLPAIVPFMTVPFAGVQRARVGVRLEPLGHDGRGVVRVPSRSIPPP